LELAAYGAMPMGYKVSGAHTGRLSGSQKNNVQNLPAGRNGQNKELRRAIMAPPGYTVVAADSSNIEVRVLVLMAAAQGKLKNFRDGKDPYLAAASSMYGEDLADLTARYKAEEPAAVARRQLAKSAELGLGYNAGPKGFMTYCRTQAKLLIDETTATETVATWRASNVEIVTLWKQGGAVLQDMVKGGAGYFGGLDGRLFYYDGSRTVLGQRIPGIRLPDGYWLNYANMRTEHDEVGRVQIIYDQLKGKNYVPNKIYGGKLVENCAQATAGAVIKYQAALMRERYAMVMQTHDELVIVAREDDTEAIPFMHSCFAAVPPWLLGVVLKGDVKAAKRYGDT
jgi:DNA polymerase family A